MKCGHCRHDNPADAEFCEGCGRALARRCARCGTRLSAGAKFCGECAAPVAAAAEQPPPAAYTPKHLADRILTSKAALEGERKQVTVLFADLKGSMELLADRDPEEARKLIDPVLELMMEAVHRYEGTVNQVMGDGIMALFGAPLAHEDHAVRACYGALRMQESVTRYAEGVFRSHGVPIQIRVGLNSGEVVVRAIGSDLHMDYTAVGQTTHLAARMEQMATPGTILLAPPTIQLARGYVQVEARGPVAVKGLADPLEVYVLIGTGAQRTRLHAAAARGFTRFIGREVESEHLRRALDLARGGHGQLVAVMGEPGVGKSRLVYEFTRSPGAQGWLILEAGAASYDKATSYKPVIDLLKTYFKVHDRDTQREIREKVTGKVLALDRTLEPILPALLTLLDVPIEDAQWQALDPSLRRQRTLEAVKRLLLRESQGQPALLVFEDLHWIDSETQAVLDSLVESLPAARLLLLVSYRPEYEHRWGNRTYYSRLWIDALPPERAGDLLNVLLGDDPGLEPLRRLLVRRGNPFFIEESIRTLEETGALTRDKGAYRLARPIQAIEVPATVQVILAARIDRLSGADKQLLQTASVIGRVVPFGLLHAVVGSGPEVVQQGLSRLQAADLLYETRLFPEAEYTFKHALTHEVTYGTLLQTSRKILHARIVGALERIYPDRLTEHVERLAHHAMRGERWEPAVTYLRQAGAKAFARSANREAVTWLEQALTALEHLPRTRERLEQAIDLRFELRSALYALGEVERILVYLREAEGLARAIDDARRLGQMSVYLCHSLCLAGDPKEARGLGERAGAIGESLGDVSLQATGNLYFGAACICTGDYRRAEAALRGVLPLLEGELSRERLGQTGFPAVSVHYYLVWALADLGQFEEGLIHGREGIRLAEALDVPYSLANMCWMLAYLQLVRGELAPAVALLDRMSALSREWNLTFLSVFNPGGRGYAYALSGRIAEGIPLLEQALSATEAQGFAVLQPLFLLYLGEAYVLAGRREDALERAGRALTLARERGLRGFEAWALRLLGDVTARRDPATHADRHYRDALALAAELGMRPLVAHCHLGLGSLNRRPDDDQQAREHLTIARTMYREMGMAYWLEKAEAMIPHPGSSGPG